MPIAVTPVVDYEPPIRVIGNHRPSLRRPRTAHRRPPPPAALSPALRAAAAFADAALRQVLEVIDRRRPLAQLLPLLSAGLADSLSMPRATVGAGTAVLRRVRLQPVGQGECPSAVEVFGTYTRGPRTHAIACRAALRPDTARWQVVALHIG